jgi:hypothetical protein
MRFPLGLGEAFVPHPGRSLALILGDFSSRHLRDAKVTDIKYDF